MGIHLIFGQRPGVIANPGIEQAGNRPRRLRDHGDAEIIDPMIVVGSSDASAQHPEGRPDGRRIERGLDIVENADSAVAEIERSVDEEPSRKPAPPAQPTQSQSNPPTSGNA